MATNVIPDHLNPRLRFMIYLHNQYIGGPDVDSLEEAQELMSKYRPWEWRLVPYWFRERQIPELVIGLECGCRKGTVLMEEKDKNEHPQPA